MCRLYVVSFVDMWDLKAFLKIRSADIEFESNFSSISQHLRSTEYSTFLIAKNFGNRPSEIEYQSDFSRFVFNSYLHFQLLENFEN